MGLCDEVRRSCAEIAARARSVTIDLDRVGAIEPGPPPELDPERHYLEGSPEDVAMYTLTLDAINFGSGWFPTLRKRPGCSGYFTVAWALADRFRADGPWTPARAAGARRPARWPRCSARSRDHELMELFARGAERPRAPSSAIARPLEAVAAAGRLRRAARRAARERDALLRRPRLLQARADHRQRPHPGRRRRVRRHRPAHDLRRQPRAPRAAGGRRAASTTTRWRRASTQRSCSSRASEEREIRACALHACEAIAAELGVPPRILDMWLWNRGQEPRYKAVPRHRTRTVFY